MRLSPGTLRDPFFFFGRGNLHSRFLPLDKCNQRVKIVATTWRHVLPPLVLASQTSSNKKESPPGRWRSFDPRPSPDFSLRLRDKTWEWPGDEAMKWLDYILTILEIHVCLPFYQCTCLTVRWSSENVGLWPVSKLPCLPEIYQKAPKYGHLPTVNTEQCFLWCPPYKGSTVYICMVTYHFFRSALSNNLCT